MKSIILKILTYINRVIPKNKNYILFTSHPDMTDNSYAFYEYMISKHSDRYIFIWLVEPKFSIKDKHTLKKTKIISKKSILGFYYYCRAKYLFFTHNNYASLPTVKSQIGVNLWHGMPLKKIGHLDNKPYYPKTNFTISTSPIFQKIMSDAFHQPLNSVLITGQPRNQYLLNKDKHILKLLNINKNKYKKIIAWLPTYRTSSHGEIRNDGTTFDLLPLVSKSQLKKFDKFLSLNNIFCFIKLHPVDIISKDDFDTYTNIQVLDNSDFNIREIQLYSFLANIDALITDYSSVYIDYMLTKNPIGFVIPDIDSYKKNRGFSFENALEKLPGDIIKTYTEFENFIENIVNNNSVTYMDNGLFEFYHSIESNFSEKIYNIVFKGDKT